MKNYCTGLGKQPDGINSCCQKHDNAYGVNGPATGRKAADLALFQCFVKNGASPLKAFSAYVAVRVFGVVRWYYVRAFKEKK